MLITVPVCFAEVLEVVHVAAGGRVLSVFGLPLFGVGDLQQVSVIFHHVLAFVETPGGEHCSPLSFYMLHLQRSMRNMGEKNEILKCLIITSVHTDY